MDKRRGLAAVIAADVVGAAALVGSLVTGNVWLLVLLGVVLIARFLLFRWLRRRVRDAS